MMIYRTSGIAIFGLLAVVSIFSQSAPVQSGSRLAPLVRNSLDAAVPAAADFSRRMWQNWASNDRITRSELEKTYSEARTELRRSALIQLQPVSELSKQLNAVNRLVDCALEANEKLGNLAIYTSNPIPSWPQVSTMWAAVAPELKCVSSPWRRSGAASSSQPRSPIIDPVLQDDIDGVFQKVESTIAEVGKNMALRDRAEVTRSVRLLASQMTLFYVVAAVQVARLSEDMNELASINTMGATNPSSSALLPKLKRLLDEVPSER